MSLIVNQDLYLSVDGASLVPAGSPDASDVLYARKGNRLNQGECEKFGLFKNPTKKKAKKTAAASSPAVPDAGDGTFQCDVCGKEAKTRSGLQAHQRAKHEAA